MLYKHNTPANIHIVAITHSGIKGGFITIGLYKFSGG